MPYIYCAYNECYKIYGENVYKLGKSKNVNKRLRTQDAFFLSAVELMHYEEVIDETTAEQLLFDKLKNERINSKKEFFRCPLMKIKETMKDVRLLLEIASKPRFDQPDISVEFQQLLTKDNNQNKFNIDLEIAAKFLLTKKGNIKRRLTSNYTIDVDYTITKKKTSKGRGRCKMEILLTCDCFKLISMSSNGKNAEYLRNLLLPMIKTNDDEK